MSQVPQGQHTAPQATQGEDGLVSLMVEIPRSVRWKARQCAAARNTTLRLMVIALIEQEYEKAKIAA